jgi:hypothetical protein
MQSAGVLSEPGHQIGGSGEIQQRLCQSLQLIQGQGIDAGGRVVAQAG